MKFLNEKLLKKQLQDQQKHNFQLEDIDWDVGIDSKKFLLPLDKNALCFPGASSEQRLAISQYLGLLFNAITAEMEHVAYSLKEIAWRNILDDFPVNPEMYDLGEQFFAEEAKHSKMLLDYNELFCKSFGIDYDALKTLFPASEGTRFKRTIKQNALKGGHAFWWVVAATEDVAIKVFGQLNRHEKGIDPLYYQIQKLHFLEESKHASYAFMMLDLIASQPKSIAKVALDKTELLRADMFGSAWLISSLHKIFGVEKLKDQSPFFKTLASCLPLIKKKSYFSLAKEMWISAPYVSLYLNKNYHRQSLATAKAQKAIRLFHPQPITSLTYTE